MVNNMEKNFGCKDWEKYIPIPAVTHKVPNTMFEPTLLICKNLPKFQ